MACACATTICSLTPPRKLLQLLQPRIGVSPAPPPAAATGTGEAVAMVATHTVAVASSPSCLSHRSGPLIRLPPPEIRIPVADDIHSMRGNGRRPAVPVGQLPGRRLVPALLEVPRENL